MCFHELIPTDTIVHISTFKFYLIFLSRILHFISKQKHLVYSMERVIAVGNAAGLSEKIVLLIDYEGFSLTNGPPMKTSKETLSILQNHYPERLQCAYLIRYSSVRYRVVQCSTVQYGTE